MPRVQKRVVEHMSDAELEAQFDTILSDVQADKEATKLALREAVQRAKDALTTSHEAERSAALQEKEVLLAGIKQLAAELPQWIENNKDGDLAMHVGIRLQQIKEADEQDTQNLKNATVCEAVVERDADGNKSASCRVASAPAAPSVQPEPEQPGNGEPPMKFTNVFEFKGRKERKIENFSQNQKCKARY